MGKLILTNATVVTMNPQWDILYDQAVLIQDDRIAELGPAEQVERTCAVDVPRVDLTGQIVFPGLINTHVHSFQTLLKGLEADTELEHWLARVITPVVTRISKEQLRLGAVLSGLEAIRSGTTTVLDYQYIQYRPGMNDAAIAGYRELGLRLVLGRGYADTGVQFGANPGELESLETIGADIEDLVRRHHQQGDGMVRIALAPSVVWMCTPECLEWTRRTSHQHGLLVTIHVAETDFDNQCSLALHGRTDFGVCEAAGLVNDRLLMVHCVRLTDEEIRRAADRGAAFSYNPVSNMYLASGCPPIPALKRSGMVCSLGTDGAASNNTNDLLETMKAGVLLAKAHTRDPASISAMDILAWATCDGARALGMDRDIGSLEVGKKADLFVFDPGATAKSAYMHDPVATLVYSSDPRNIRSVLVDGRPVLWDGKLVNGDEEQLIDAACRAARALGSEQH